MQKSKFNESSRLPSFQTWANNTRSREHPIPNTPIPPLPERSCVTKNSSVFKNARDSSPPSAHHKGLSWDNSLSCLYSSSAIAVSRSPACAVSCSNKVSAGALPLNGAFKTLLIAARDGDRLPDYGVHSLRVHNTLPVPGAVPRTHWC